MGNNEPTRHPQPKRDVPRVADVRPGMAEGHAVRPDHDRSAERSPVADAEQAVANQERALESGEESPA